MSKIKKLLALVMALAMVLSLAACGSSDTTTEDTSTDDTTTEESTDDTEEAADTEEEAEDTTEETSGDATASGDVISLTVWGAEEDQTLLAELVAGFEEAYAGYATFDIQIGVESESTAKDTVLTDIEAAADVFAFADDQLADLVNAGALQSIDALNDALVAYAGKSVEDIEAANGAGSVAAATMNDTLYAFPMGGGNNYFLYYDSSVLSEEDVASWDSLLAAAEAAGKQVGMTLSSGWYNASFFIGAGFTTSLNDDGTTSIDWNGTSSLGYTGVDVVKSMLTIASNSAFMAIADGDISNQIASGSLCAAVSGTWDAEAAQTAFGDGYAATKLPTFTCAGDQVQQGCYSGFKLIGVNAYSQNAGWAALLAEYLTNEESQTARFEARQLAPTNTNAAANEAVSANTAIAASSAQDVYGVVQSVGGKFWDPTATFGEMIAQQTLDVNDDDAIQAALDELVVGVTAAVD
ncbi:MAG: extracellular solute-binding protein [Clostridiales bacterium]|nr:extracellular solute-binding protein [Clostridiales bacterium]